MNPSNEAILPEQDEACSRLGITMPALAFSPIRSLNTSITVLDSFIGGFPSGKITLIDSSDRLLFDLIHLLCIDQVIGDGREVVWIDGGNSINPYQLVGLCKRKRVSAREAMDSINLSRAFTAYQMVTLIDECWSRELKKTQAGMLIVSCFLPRDPVPETRIPLGRVAFTD